MVAQIVLGSPLALNVKMYISHLGNPYSVFSVFHLFLKKFQSLVLISHPLIKDFKTNL